MTRAPRIARASGFTLAELIVVIAIVAILAAIGIPAFSSAIQSSEKSLADNQFSIGLAAGRDAAIRTGQNAAVLFAFTPGGQVSIIPCVEVGSIKDRPNNASPWETRSVYVPLPEVRATQLPKDWMVRGYAPPEAVHDVASNPQRLNGWYDPQNAGVLSVRDVDSRIGNWVFPETHFYDLTAGQPQSQGVTRQSFIVRFEGGTGVVDTGETNLALVVLPVETEVSNGATMRSWRAGAPAPFSLLPHRVDLAPDVAKFVRMALRDAALGANPAQADETRRRLLGDESVDSVLVRPVTELALYNERSLARGLRLRQDKNNGTIYTANMTMTGRQLSKNINEWLEGYYVPNGAAEPVESDAKLYMMDRFLGVNVEIKR